MNQDVNLLTNTNSELKLALGHFIDGMPNSGPLTHQVKGIEEALKSNDAIFTFASLVEQYAKMKEALDDLELEDSMRDLNALKSLMQESADKSLSTNQAEKISQIISEIHLEQPAHTIMVTVGHALRYFANELSELREISNVIVSNTDVISEETDVVASDVFLASKRLIKEVVAISKQLIQTYPNDKFISCVLHDATQIPTGKGAFFKSIDLLERSTKYLALLIQQERCSAEEILHDIHTNLLGVFKQTTVIDKLMASTKGNADKVQLSMVAEFKNMEVKAKNIDTLDGMQKHINNSVLLMSDIMNDYAKSQTKNHQNNTKIIKNLNNKVENAANFIGKLESQLSTAKETNLIDELTTVGNRKGYVQAINKARHNWLTTQDPLALVFIDVDKFKNINDNFGHSIGDQVLKSLGQTVKNNIRSSDYIARYGGEEFVIILPDTDLKKAIQIVKKIRLVINHLKFKLRKNNQVVKITCSYGIANFTEKTCNTIDVFNGADEALYQAKEHGRDAIVVYSNDKFIAIDK
ncbi:MAG: GGDEF domain-containing protein [Pseudomonas sp.]|nr:GGDEF domain-containing protein [Pseudomonas sp.]